MNQYELLNKNQMTENQIIEVLRKIIIPETKKDFVSSGLLENLEIVDNKVILKVKLENPAMHAKKRISDAILFQIKKKFGDSIELELNFINPDNKKKNTKKGQIKNIICVASGKGGVGKSTITINLAAILTQMGFKTGVLDADIYGPSIPTLTDTVHQRPEMIKKDDLQLIQPLEVNAIKIMSIGYFTDPNNAVVWRGPMASKALTQLYTDVNWGELDFLLIDLPPGTGDIHLSMVQNIPVHGAIVVSTPQELALADVKRGIKMFQLDSVNVPILGMIENMSWFTPEELPENKYYIFGRDGVKNLSVGMGIKFLGSVPIILSLRESSDVGSINSYSNQQTKVHFQEIAENILNELSLIE